MRAALILCSVIALSACGSSSKGSQPAEQQEGTTPAAIEAINEPPAVDLAPSITDNCAEKPQGTNCEPTPDEAQKLIRAEQALKPAEGVKPRAIAQLRLIARGPNDRARLVAWRSRSGKLCTETEIAEADGGAGGATSGPCVPARCSKLCLDLMGSRSGNERLCLLSGVVDAKADELRMTLGDGHVVPYGLTGPLVPGFPGYRVFMLDLGRSLYERLELRLSDKNLAEETMSRAQIQVLRCGEEFPPALPEQEGSSQSSQLHECLQRAAPK